MAAARFPRRTWAQHLVRAVKAAGALDGSTEGSAQLVAEVSTRVSATGSQGKQPAATELSAVLEVSEPPFGWADPWLIGAIHEQSASAPDRKGRGAWYTPEPVVRGLLGLATSRWSNRDDVPPLVIDPTCGGGAFLLASADRLVEVGLEPGEALARLAGMDIDPGAVVATRLTLVAWAGMHGIGDPDALIDLEVGDSLADLPPRWRQRRLVVGNPPFASPLRSGSVPSAAADFRAANRDLLGPYADLATIHLTKAVLESEAGSTVVLVQPQSTLASQDTISLREYLANTAAMPALWASRESVFDAGVRACAPVLELDGPPTDRVVLAAGVAVARNGQSKPAEWSVLAARALGAPPLPASLEHRSAATDTGPDTGPTLAVLATATAGFRDEYYGLVAACREEPEAGRGPDHFPIVTVGLIDPLTNRWGAAACRFGGKVWERPVADRRTLEGKVQRWVERQQRPKVIVATQSKVLEPFVDRDGELIPATPLLAVHGEPGDLAHIAAIFLAPPVVAWAWGRWFGAALGVDALKLAAKQTLELPLPPNRERWDEAAALVDELDCHSDAGPGMRREVATEVAAAMNRAYGADDTVLSWWRNRIPAAANSAGR